MPNKISRKIALITKISTVLTLGFLSNVTIAMGADDDRLQPSPLSRPSLIEYLAEQHPQDHHKYQAQRLVPLTEVLHQDASTAWNSAVISLSQKDFLLSGISAFRLLTSNDLLNHLLVEKKDWGKHVIALGDLLEEKMASTMVSNPNFGIPIHNLMGANWLISAMPSIKALAFAFHEEQKADPTLKVITHSVTDIVKTYLQENKLLGTV
jgi:hypothetical protein